MKVENDIQKRGSPSKEKLYLQRHEKWMSFRVKTCTVYVRN